MARRGNLIWFVRHDGHDWRDEDMLAALDWLTSFAPARWQACQDAESMRLATFKIEWAAGRKPSLLEGEDPLAARIVQARC